LACISDTHPCGPNGRPGGASPFGGASSGIAVSVPSQNRCRPSPCARLSPARSTTAAPPHPARSAVGAPIPIRPPVAGWSGTVAGWFPCSLLFVRRRRSPTLPLRHRHGYAADFPRDLPSRRSCPTQKAPHRDAQGEEAPHPARIHQVRAGNPLRGVMTPVPHVLLSVSLAEPAPSGSADALRLCQGRSHPFRHHPKRAALSYADLLRQARGGGLPPPLEQQRLTAHRIRELGVRVPSGAQDRWGAWAAGTRFWPFALSRSRRGRDADQLGHGMGYRFRP
jgi:hypothetical protein